METTDNSKYLERIKKDLIKTYGEGIAKSGCDVLDRKPEIIRIAPSLNAALNGGIPEGTITVISGKQKSGKTTSTLSLVASAQAQGKHVYYHDVEWRLKSMNLGEIEGLKTDGESLTIIRSEAGRILHAEDHLRIMEKIANNHPGCVIVIDSVSAMCSEKEFSDEISAFTRPTGPKLMAQITRKLSNVIAVNNITVIMIIHLINNVSGYGEKYIEDSGVKLQYALDTKIRVKDSKPWTIGSGDNIKHIGLIITWKVAVGALKTIPGTECTSYIRFGVGIDKIAEYIDLGIKLGFINKAGAWFNYGEHKFQGEAKLYDFFKENESELQKLIDQLTDIYGFQL